MAASLLAQRGQRTVKASGPSKLNLGFLDYRRHPGPVTIGSLSSLVIGLTLGAAAHRWHSSALLAAVPVFEPIGQLWLNALLMITLPLVVSLLMAAVLGCQRSREAGKLGGYTALWFLLLLIVTGLFTVLAGTALVKWFPVDHDTRLAMQSGLGVGEKQAALRVGPTGSFRDWLVSLVPSNLVKAAGSGEMLPLIVAALLFALTIRGISEEHRLLLQKLFQAVAETTLALAGYLLRVLPLAVFAFTFGASAKSGATIAGGIAYYVIAVSVLLVAVTLVLYPVTCGLGRISLSRFAKGVLHCQAIAVATRSSVASLPALLDRGRTRIGLPEEVATFVLPLSVSVFKLNRTISSPLKVIILAHLYGIHVDFALTLFFVLAATLLSFGSPGLPSGGSLVTLPLYLAAGLPVQGIVLINAVDSIPDIFKTLLNVTADMSVATIVTRFAGFTLTAESRPKIASLEPAVEPTVLRDSHEVAPVV